MRIPDLPYLIVHRGKHGDRYILATNEEEYKLAWLTMFHCIRKWDGYYFPDDMEGDEAEWYDMAMKGDWRGALWLLDYRTDHEYEDVFGICISTPENDLKHLEMKRCDTCGNYFDECRSVPGCIVRSILPSHICAGCDPLKKIEENYER